MIFSMVTAISAGPASADWVRCIAKSSSHTGRYTFRISRNPCSVYWLEIDTELKIKICALPVISALKPSARDDLSVVWFDLSSGTFYDYLSGVKDFGTCSSISDPTK